MVEYIVLPLFSDKGERHVQVKSGLNQWNAYGRPRNFDEVYIPIPSWIHSNFNTAGFLPNRDTSFTLILPDRTRILAKVCQDNSKALMSNPNAKLGRWILREVLNLGYGELATYQTLRKVGIDSVTVYKQEEKCYSIEASTIGIYDKFKDSVNKKY